eukprot:CAMPEP_0173370326 /NCGR_PEP_ID=MMETSP1144-20121109/26626_1 /TAXON_ID=483371 /ORGANISM="non described non described, Strain CCMP2298" /LENGTH=34 /DNA_ID= /DNA_START= /DNA_END= /DNA_ORIENTATION=
MAPLSEFSTPYWELDSSSSGSPSLPPLWLQAELP